MCFLTVFSSDEKALPGIMHVSGCSEPPVIYEDPIQRVRVAFVGELDPPVAEVVRKGRSRSTTSNPPSSVRAPSGASSSEPQPAVAFAGRRIAFLMTPKYLLVEYVEAA